MNKVKFKLNRAGVKELLKSREMQSICTDYANRIQAKAGAGYEVSSYTGRNRVNASVIASSYPARQDNLEHNTLLKALGGSK